MTAQQPHPPRRITHEQLRINGLRIHAQIRGEGEPLLLFSGIWGEVGLWEGLLPHLPGFRTIAFDPPGIGRSQMPPVPLTMPALVRYRHGGTRRTRHRFRPRARRVVRWRGRTADGDLAPGPGAPPRAGVDVLRRLRQAGQASSFWHFIHPLSYHPPRLERVAGTMFGGRLRTEPELVRTMHIKRPTNILAAMYRMAPLFGWTSLPWLWTIGHPDTGHRRRRRPGHPAGESPDHRHADAPGEAAHRAGRRPPGPARQRTRSGR